MHFAVDLHRKSGQVTDPYAPLRVDHRILTTADEDYIHTLIEATPWMKSGTSCFRTRGVRIPCHDLADPCPNANFEKSLSWRAAERNERLRWESEIAELEDPTSSFSLMRLPSTTRLSSALLLDGQPLPMGCSVSRTFLREKRHSILPLLICSNV